MGRIIFASGKRNALDGCLFVVTSSQRKYRDLKRGLMPAQSAYVGQCFRLARQWCVEQRAK